MGDSTISGFWKWLLILLVVCDLGLVVMLWSKPRQAAYDDTEEFMREEHEEHEAMGIGRRHHDGNRRGPINFDRELNLTPDQRARFDNMRVAQQQRIDSIKKLAGVARGQFFDNLNAANPDSVKLAELNAQLGNYHRQIEMMTFTHFREVRGILNTEQKVLFDKFIKQALQHMPEQPRTRGEGPGEPGGPGCRPDDHPGPPEGDEREEGDEHERR